MTCVTCTGEPLGVGDWLILLGCSLALLAAGGIGGLRR